MASIVSGKNRTRRVDYFNAAGARKSLYLGKVTKKQAETIMSHVETLVAAQAAKTSPPLDTATWLGGIGDKLHAKLVKHGLTTALCDTAERPAVEAPKPRLGSFVAEYIAKRKTVKPGTKWVYRHTERNLIAFFGADKELASITSADADDFRVWLETEEELAEATLRKRCSVARQFFRRAVKAKLIEENPFGEMKNISVGASPEERVYFLEPAAFEKVVAAIPSADVNLRTIFALARWGGLRCPSEPAALTWGNVDWEKGRLIIPSPKTGKREAPIFPELRPYLAAAFRHAESLGRAGAGDSVLSRGDGSTNWRSPLEDAIRRAKLASWPKLFQNLRSTRETELMKRHTIAVVCAWLGNSPKVALKHYAQVTDADFAAALGVEKAQQKTQQSAADNGKMTRTGKDTNPRKCRNPGETGVMQ